MTSKEKAEELVNNMCDTYDPDCTGYVITFVHGKQCALIAVDEIVKTLNKDIKDINVVGNVLLDLIEYWQEVKQEIEKL